MKAEKLLLRETKKHNRIIIYGAGMVAQLVHRWFVSQGIEKKIWRFAISYRGDNPNKIDTIPVVEIDELDCEKKDVLVIVATLENAHKEIIEVLQKKDFHNIFPITSEIRKDISGRIHINNKKKLYICEGYYHVLISVVKILTNCEKADLMLTNGLEKNRTLQYRLLKENLVDNVITFNKGKVEEHFSGNTFIHKKSDKRRLVKNFEKEFTNDMSRYWGGVYLFFDNDKIARYLQAKKQPYHLIEDSYNFMKDVLAFKYSENVEYWSTWKCKIDCLFNLEYQPFGKSKFCKSIEVNDINGIVCPKNKSYEKPRIELFSKLTDKDKEKIFRIFAGDCVLDVHRGEKSVLLISQPLFKDGFVPTLQCQINIYEYIINEVCEKFDKIYLKAHPRDDFPYESLNIDKLKIIDKNIPTEVFNFQGKVFFDEAITINSTAIHNIQFVERKQSLGIEFLKKFIDKKDYNKLTIKL